MKHNIAIKLLQEKEKSIFEEIKICNSLNFTGEGDEYIAQLNKDYTQIRESINTLNKNGGIQLYVLEHLNEGSTIPYYYCIGGSGSNDSIHAKTFKSIKEANNHNSLELNNHYTTVEYKPNTQNARYYIDNKLI